uniref:Transposase n=1 Tax=Panagrellus redivivus TaxID=6233 RepID=A0A7E4VGX6_PANRE
MRADGRTCAKVRTCYTSCGYLIRSFRRIALIKTWGEVPPTFWIDRIIFTAILAIRRNVNHIISRDFTAFNQHTFRDCSRRFRHSNLLQAATLFLKVLP